MKRQTSIMLFRLFAGLSLFTGLIAIIFLVFLPLNSQKSKNNPTSVTPSVVPSQTSNETPTQAPEGKFCGGIAAIRCPESYICKLDGNYPDAGGQCVKTENSKSEEDEVFCTMDAKQCPDGSFVGRQGPKCEFAPCPKEL